MSDSRRWTVLSKIDEAARWVSFGERLTEQGAANAFVPWGGSIATFDEPELFAGYHFVRIGSGFAPVITPRLKIQSTWTALQGAADGIVRDGGVWWPRSALFESFGEILIGLGPKLDPRGSVVVAGAGAVARTAVSALFRAGFKTFLMTGADEPAVTSLITEIKTRQFGLNVDWLPPKRLVTLPGESSVLVNCESDTHESHGLLTELSYLNFLKRTGFVIDLTRARGPSVLVTETREAKVDLVTYVDVAARTDVRWAKWAFGVDIDLERRRTDLEAVLS